MTEYDRRHAIEQAFIAGIRSVLLIDDQFPTYGELANGVPDTRKSPTEHAVRLWKGFRELHMICDVASDLSQINPEYLIFRDLIVLDYEFSPQDGGIAARNLLRTLVSRPRLNLVVIYTNMPDLSAVQLQVAASLAGVPSLLLDLDEDDDDDFHQWSKSSGAPTDTLLRNYLIHRDQSRIWLANVPADWQDVDPRFVERKIRDHLNAWGACGARTDFRCLEFADPGDSRVVWVRCDSVFVAFAKKDPGDTAESIRTVLLDSLHSWDPSFMRIMLGLARSHIAEQGLTGDDRVLKDAETEAAWIYYMRQSADPVERRDRIRMLFGRLAEDLLDDYIASLEDFSNDHPAHDEPVPQMTAQDREHKNIASALERAGLPSTTDPRLVIHKLNYYLAFDRGLPSHVRAGTVFVDLDSNEFGICTTPNCDLVPGRAMKDRARAEKARLKAQQIRQDRSDIHENTEHVATSADPDAARLAPFHRIVYRPARRIDFENEKKLNFQLKNAENARALFLHVPKAAGGGYILLSLVESDSSEHHPDTRVLYLEREGKVDDDHCFGGRKIVASEQDPELIIERRRYRAVGQLRDSYALKFLHEAGHHLSRPGVDFARWPPRRDDDGDSNSKANSSKKSPKKGAK